MKRHAPLLAGMIAILLLIGLAGCGAATPDATVTATDMPQPTPTGTPTHAPSSQPPDLAEQLTVEVMATYPHDRTAFTEGLVFDEGHMYESTGRYGMSTLREVDLKSGDVLQSVSLGESYFGEGLAVYNQTLVQLTWREKLAFTYDKSSLGRRGQMVFNGEGWGLCFDGENMIMSDGSDGLTIRSPETFQAKASVTVSLNGEPVEMLNELECLGDVVYANVWHTDSIMRIDKASGRVTGVIDASGLLTDEEIAVAGNEGVLNGIAYDPQRDVFLVTGKNWPRLFEVKFIPAE